MLSIFSILMSLLIYLFLNDLFALMIQDSNTTDAKICIEDTTTDDQHHSDTTLHVLYIPKP